MPTPPARNTVDLSAYPDLVVIYLDEQLVYSEDPPHYGMRRYWRDFAALEAWSLTLPHKRWWSGYLRNRGGTSFWHETYFRRGGFEAIYVDTESPVGLARFAPTTRAQGPIGARSRADADRASAVSPTRTA